MNSQNNNGESALHYGKFFDFVFMNSMISAICSSTKVIDYLIGRGANVNIRNKYYLLSLNLHVNLLKIW